MKYFSRDINNPDTPYIRLTHANNICLPYISDALIIRGDSWFVLVIGNYCVTSTSDRQTLLSQRSVITEAHCAQNIKRQNVLSAKRLLFKDQRSNYLPVYFCPRCRAFGLPTQKTRFAGTTSFSVFKEVFVRSARKRELLDANREGRG